MKKLSTLFHNTHDIQVTVYYVITTTTVKERIVQHCRFTMLKVLSSKREVRFDKHD